MHRWFVLMVVAGLPLVSPAENACTVERPGKVFDALEAIDDSGEERLRIVLSELSAQEGWSKSDWEHYTLGLADNARADSREERRNDLVTEIFGVVTRVPIDCEKLDMLEAEVLNIERQQWDDAVRRVEERLERGTGVKGST